MGKGTVAATIGIVTLLIGATTVFGEIQDSINDIWGLKPKPEQRWLKLIKYYPMQKLNGGRYGQGLFLLPYFL